MMHPQGQTQIPCLHCHPHRYITMVSIIAISCAMCMFGKVYKLQLLFFLCLKVVLECLTQFLLLFIDEKLLTKVDF